MRDHGGPFIIVEAFNEWEDLVGDIAARGNPEEDAWFFPVGVNAACVAGFSLLAADGAVHNRALKEKWPRVFRVLTNVREVCGVAVVAAIAGLAAWYISDTLIRWLIDIHESLSQSITQYCKGAC